MLFIVLDSKQDIIECEKYYYSVISSHQIILQTGFIDSAILKQFQNFTN